MLVFISDKELYYFFDSIRKIKHWHLKDFHSLKRILIDIAFLKRVRVFVIDELTR